MCSKSRKLVVEYTPSVHQIVVLSDYLRINYTKEYVKSLTGLPEKESKRVLYWLGRTFDEDKGINIKIIREIGEGVLSGLL